MVLVLVLAPEEGRYSERQKRDGDGCEPRGKKASEAPEKLFVMTLRTRTLPRHAYS